MYEANYSWSQTSLIATSRREITNHLAHSGEDGSESSIQILMGPPAWATIRNMPEIDEKQQGKRWNLRESVPRVRGMRNELYPGIKEVLSVKRENTEALPLKSSSRKFRESCDISAIILQPDENGEVTLVGSDRTKSDRERA